MNPFQGAEYNKPLTIYPYFGIGLLDPNNNGQGFLPTLSEFFNQVIDLGLIPSGASYNFINGLTQVGDDVGLGGLLVADTVINGSSTYSLSLTDLTNFTVSSDNNLILSAVTTARIGVGVADITANSSDGIDLLLVNLPLTINSDPGIAGQALLSTGPGSAPEWGDLGSLFWRTDGNSGTNPATDFVGTTDNNDLYLKANNTLLASFQANGDVLINQGSGNSQILFQGADITLTTDLSGQPYNIAMVTGSGLFFNTTSANDLVVADNGNVGIGIASPSYKLDVLGTFNQKWVNGDDEYTINVSADYSSIRLSRVNTATGVNESIDVGNGNIVLATGDGTNSLNITQNDTAYVLFHTLLPNIFKVDTATGNIGINQSTPTEKLDVDGNFRLSGSVLLEVNETSSDIALDKTSSNLVYTGATGSWTLPSLATVTDIVYFIKNGGSGTLTITADGSDNIFTNSDQTSIILNVGDAVILVGGTKWWVE